MRKRKLKAEWEIAEEQNVILRARVSELQATNAKLQLHLAEVDDWISPDEVPVIVDVVLGELVGQLLKRHIDTTLSGGDFHEAATSGK